MATSDRDGKPTGHEAQWHRWQMGSLEREPRAASGSESAHREQQRRRLETQARDAEAKKAREAGFQAGHEEGKAQGYDAGYAEGLAAAQAAAELEFHKRVTLCLDPLAELADGFHHALQSLDDHIADQLVELALIAGRQLAGDALEAHPEQILAIVNELLDADTSLSGKPRLWLHPDDLELVTQSIGDALAAANWECLSDPALARGGCRVTSAGGGLDASLDTQWKAILDQRRHRRVSALPDDDQADTDG
ncbi:flagellar assembly protein FliH [Salinicola rhizosphaerae]|uniref:Flagellar assembly protein FliH n=1 Tax=Salinicola rhizosphaerae TaxID=1443141 RepID=A0ABQ3DT90_9GAMM|nr:flagellar assembly protein FliH [Salinicola rhizosphaerae]GHB08688.1 flagellar assembly protein FliH [Salinicola rhizosphaerae]